MKKVVGYIISLVGLGLMALSFGIFKLELEIFSMVEASRVMWFGVFLVVVGIVIALVFGKGKEKQKTEEVPIYEGTGKGRKIVGYRRD